MDGTTSTAGGRSSPASTRGPTATATHRRPTPSGSISRWTTWNRRTKLAERPGLRLRPATCTAIRQDRLPGAPGVNGAFTCTIHSETSCVSWTRRRRTAASEPRLVRATAADKTCHQQAHVHLVEHVVVVHIRGKLFLP